MTKTMSKLSSVLEPYKTLIGRLREPVDDGGHDGRHPDPLHDSAANAIEALAEMIACAGSEPKSAPVAKAMARFSDAMSGQRPVTPEERVRIDAAMASVEAAFERNSALDVCPFCGAPALYEEDPPGNGVFRYTVSCGGKACPVTSVCAVAKTKELVVAAWNGRA